MSGVLLDTNVVFELTRADPDRRVCTYLAQVQQSYLSVVTVLELQYCIERKPKGKRQSELSAAIDKLLSTHQDALLDIDRRSARLAGSLRAKEEAAGRTLHLADALIAATALTYRLTLATRNVRDFEHLGVPLANPWNA